MKNRVILTITLCLVYIPILLLTFVTAYWAGSMFYMHMLSIKNLLITSALIAIFVMNLFYIVFIFRLIISIKTNSKSIREINIFKYKKVLMIITIILLIFSIISPIWIGIEFTKVLDIKTVKTYK